MSSDPFPVQGLLPKGETGASRFLAAHPAADGRGILVAIFDTGCDPLASGLQVTTDGKPKYVDFFDGSGSGDVDTSVEVEARGDGEVQFTSPVTQRLLTVPASIASRNPSGKWRLGVKRAYEIFPSPLIARMKTERKKVFDEAQRKLEQELQARLARFDEEAAKRAESESDSASASSSSPPAASSASAANSYPPSFTSKDKADLEARLAEVRATSAKYEDCGPVWDVLVWHDGSAKQADQSSASSTDAGGVDERVVAAANSRERGWFVAVDSTGTGNFTGARALTNYAHGGGCATFSGLDLMNYTVNIYDSGRLVSLVVTAGSHGTHVAGIVAANETAQGGLGEEYNGIAPGAQLVSIKIGDSRLGSMETGQGLVRGLIEAIRLKVDVINMSYGEAASIPNSGRLSELIRSAVFDHGIVFVSSAGNNGPALSSSGSPGSTDTGVISVGAYVSPNMSLACYSSRRALPRECMYSWSSRGPTTDGAQGVTISACGGAVTSVCEWQLQRSQLMNGTSMSSPAAAGGIALLLSGLKSKGIRWTPQRIKAAIENSARLVPGVEKLAQGQGLLQVDRAWEHLVRNAHRPELDLHYKVSVPALGGARGLYLREAADTSRAFEASVMIEPVFKEQRLDSDMDDASSPAEVTAADGASGSTPDAAAEAKESEEAETAPAPARSPTSSTSSGSPSSSPAPEGVAHPGNYALNKSRRSFQQNLVLQCDPPAPWVEAPGHLVLMHGGRSITVVLHGEALAPGLHYTELLGFDASMASEGERRAAGPLFRVPITVLKPESPAEAQSALVASSIQMGGSGDVASTGGSAVAGANYKFTNLRCGGAPEDTGRVHRKFIVVPEGATHADFTVRLHSLEASAAAAAGADKEKEGADEAAASSSSPAPSPSPSSSASPESETNRSFMFHALYLSPEEAFRDHELNSFFSLNAESPLKEFRMNVRAGLTLEVALTQYWSNLGACQADIEVSFGGVLVDGAGANGEVVLDGSTPFAPVRFRNVLRTAKLNPTAVLSTWCQPVRPQSSSIVQLSRERDLIARGSKLIYMLRLQYAFELKEDSSNVRVRAPALNERLYESAYESQLTSIFDASKRFCFSTDAFETGKALKAGRYTARISVRHDDHSMLERLKDMAVVVEAALGKEISLGTYASYNTAVSGGAKYGANKSLKPGRTGLVYLGLPDAKAFPSFAKPGDWGAGNITITKGEFGGEKAGSIKLRVYAPPVPAAASSAASTSAASNKNSAASNAMKKPAEGEQDPAFPKLEQKDPTASPIGVASPGPSTGSGSVGVGASVASSPSGSASTLATELRDLTISHLDKLKKDGDVEKKIEALRTVLPPLLAAFPSHLPLLFLELRLMHEVNQSRPRDSPDRDDSGVASKAQAVLTRHIDQTSLAAHFGRRVPSDDKDASPEVLALRKDKEEIRRTLVKTLVLQLEAAADELRTFKDQMMAVEYQSDAKAALSSGASGSGASSSPGAFALSLANLHTLLAEASSWVDITSKEHKKTFAPFQVMGHKLARQFGTLWKQLSADIAAAATAGDAALQKQLQADKVDLLTSLAQHEPLYKHLLDYEKTWAVVRFPRDFAPW